MKTIFITLTRGSVIRNYCHTGVISSLVKSGVRVVALVPWSNDAALRHEIESYGAVCERLEPPSKIRFGWMFTELFRGMAFNDTIRTYYRYKFLTYEPSYLMYYPRAAFYWIISRTPGLRTLVRTLDRIVNPQRENDAVFKRYEPDLVFLTTPHERSEIGVAKGARRLGIPVAGMPKSWDNLSKTVFPAMLDHMFVWSDYMKDESIRFQGYRSDCIEVVGIPQFDFYARPDLLIPRGEFCRMMGLDPEKRIILYGSTGAAFNENGYLEIIHRFGAEGALSQFQVLMRPHVGYAGEMEKFDPLEHYQGFVVDRTAHQSSVLKDKWDISLDHARILFSSLVHAAVCVNIASTLTLDATACGTPVVNVCFDIDPVPARKSIARVYETDYFGSVIKFGATWVATDADQFKRSLVEALQSKNGRARERQRLLDYFVSRLDGASAKRLAAGILRLLG